MALVQFIMKPWELNNTSWNGVHIIGKKLCPGLALSYMLIVVAEGNCPDLHWLLATSREINTCSLILAGASGNQDAALYWRTKLGGGWQCGVTEQGWSSLGGKVQTATVLPQMGAVRVRDPFHPLRDYTVGKEPNWGQALSEQTDQGQYWSFTSYGE